MMCPNEGCNAIVSSELRRYHEKNCLYRRIACPNDEQKCGKFPARSLAEHTKVCPSRNVTCEQGCGKTCHWSELSAHVQSECPNTTVSCLNEGCGFLGLRSAVMQHKLECPQEVVTCEFDEFGCKPEEDLKRMNLQGHLEANGVKHSSLLAAEVKSQQAQIAHLLEKVAELEKQQESSWPCPISKFCHEEWAKHREEHFEKCKQALTQIPQQVRWMMLATFLLSLCCGKMSFIVGCISVCYLIARDKIGYPRLNCVARVAMKLFCMLAFCNFAIFFLHCSRFLAMAAFGAALVTLGKRKYARRCNHPITT